MLAETNFLGFLGACRGFAKSCSTTHCTLLVSSTLRTSTMYELSLDNPYNAPLYTPLEKPPLRSLDYSGFRLLAQEPRAPTDFTGCCSSSMKSSLN